MATSIPTLVQPRLMKKLSDTAAPKSVAGSLADHKSSTISEVIPIEKIAAIKRKMLAKKRQTTIRQGDEEFKTDGVGRSCDCHMTTPLCSTSCMVIPG